MLDYKLKKHGLRKMDIDDGCQLILLDAVTRELTRDDITWGAHEKINDATYYFNRETRHMYRSKTPLIVFICSNLSPYEIWDTSVIGFFNLRFIFISLDDVDRSLMPIDSQKTTPLSKDAIDPPVPSGLFIYRPQPINPLLLNMPCVELMNQRKKWEIRNWIYYVTD